ncbi:MAG: hypothetical protein AAF927_04085 [Bacteroidota bacterium]
MKVILAIATVLMLTFVACTSYEPYARPYGFPRIEVPGPAERSYTNFSNQSCPFTFEYPVGGTITRDLKDSCWVDIQFPDYNLTWHITYRDVDDNRSRASHFEDYRRLVYKHSKKATQITEAEIKGPNGYGILFELYGTVGTPAQIFYSDSSGQQIAMLSFYYRTAEKNDSLQPLTDYMKEELQHMVQTVQWK